MQGVKTTPSTPPSLATTRRHQERIGWLFVLPHLILFSVFLLAPTLYGFFISLREWHVLAKHHPFVGLANYQAALSDDIFGSRCATRPTSSSSSCRLATLFH